MDPILKVDLFKISGRKMNKVKDFLYLSRYQEFQSGNPKKCFNFIEST